MVLDLKYFVLYKSEYLEIVLNFYFDKTTAVFAAIGSFLNFIVTIFSRYYMHRDWGFKRYFTTILLFFMSYNLVVFSGNFETLFIGWEFLGICSFILIAFYRDRYLPVKNSLKVISIYRIGDICLFLAMWLGHHLWHENISYLKLNDTALVAGHISENYWPAVFISLLLVIAAAVKSAQLPFSSWLPRAMEGPTTSSAIFYGSLSVNLGVFLLLRTYPYWENLLIIKILIIVLGLFTSLVATSIARVQSTVKTQIAYASIAQIGLMFIEISFGFHILALVHFAGNAFLRTYQLLVSPSVLNYRIHDMVFNYVSKTRKTDNSLISKLKNSIYILSVKEWNLDFFKNHYLWNPLKWMGKRLSFFSAKPAALILPIFFLAGIFVYLFKNSVNPYVVIYLPYVYSFTGLALIIKALSEQKNALKAWLYLASSQVCIVLAVAIINQNFSVTEIIIYLSGVLAATVVGIICLQKTQTIDSDTRLSHFHGYIYEKPITGIIFLVCCLAMAGLPFTPTFLGVDILFCHIKQNQIPILIFTSLSYMLFEISLLRIYAHIFLGPHKKDYHAMAFKSS